MFYGLPCVILSAFVRPLRTIVEDDFFLEKNALELEAALSTKDKVDPQRAAMFLDCDGLGDEHSFWPEFREAFVSQGVFGRDTLRLAHQKWTEWEDFVESIAHRFWQGNSLMIPLPGESFVNGTPVETYVTDRMDLIRALMKAGIQALMGDPALWGPNDLAGFLACPVGFVMVQYIIFMVHKVRSRMSLADRKMFWESFAYSFSLILGLPSYVLDHLESSHWGITSFDLAVNINTEEGWYRSYKEYCDSHPVPAPRATTWRVDAPYLASILESGTELQECFGTDSLEKQHGYISSTTFRLAIIGEHGPTNLDHLSTVSGVVDRNSATEAIEKRVPKIEAAHFFTYLWNLEGTAEGERLHSTLRISWESFWGEPLTETKGRTMTASPRWTIGSAVKALRGWAARDSFLRSSELVVCCEPLWMCVLLHAARGARRLLVRASMCLLHTFAHVFVPGQLQHFWPLVHSFSDEVGKSGRLSAASRISAEMLNFQTGIRAPYVPALSLHVRDVASYAPSTADVLLFRSSLPALPTFRRMIKLLSAEAEAEGLTVPRVVLMKPGVSLSYEDIAKFRAVAILPHVPYALRLADMYAIGTPILVPSEPYLHKFVWPFAGPFCGRSDPPLARTVDPMVENCSNCYRPPYSPFVFQEEELEAGEYHDERRYWLQYSEWEMRPHLVRFGSAREFLKVAQLSEADALAISGQMRKEYERVVGEGLAYWKVAVLSALQTK